MFALSDLGDNDVSRVKRGRWNKKVWETWSISYFKTFRFFDFL